MDISGDKQAKYHKTKENLKRETGIPSDSSWKQRHKDYVKARIDLTI